jgi:NifU-like protein involved in Fe-S cluster formation
LTEIFTFNRLDKEFTLLSLNRDTMPQVPDPDHPSPRFQRHLQDPHHPGLLDPADGEGRAANPVCGDELRLTIRVESGTIAEARFQASGCAATLAAGSAVTRMLEGLSLSEATRDVTPEAVEAAIDGLPPNRRHAALLASQAAARAVRAAAARPQKFA